MTDLYYRNFDSTEFKPYQIDCSKCYGLCCIGLCFSKMDGFPENKAAGKLCKYLLPNYSCKIHSLLNNKGLKGCISYDCLGAGQKICDKLSFVPKWYDENIDKVFIAFIKVVQLYQTIWYLKEASLLKVAYLSHEQLDLLIKEGENIAEDSIENLALYDLEPFQTKANTLIKDICWKLCDSLGTKYSNSSVSDYMGKDLRNRNLTGKDFSMSFLIAANLEGAILYGANFLGADMRDVKIKNTDLSKCLFLTQQQINSALGNSRTQIPPHIKRPDSWDL